MKAADMMIGVLVVLISCGLLFYIGCLGGGDGQLPVLNAPRKDCLFFDSRRWNRVLNLSHLGKEKDEEEAFEKELRRVGVFHGSQVFLTPFYPVQRQEILNSWRRNLLIPPEELAYLQAALWRLKKEWLVN